MAIDEVVLVLLAMNCAKALGQVIYALPCEYKDAAISKEGKPVYVNMEERDIAIVECENACLDHNVGNYDNKEMCLYWTMTDKCEVYLNRTMSFNLVDSGITNCIDPGKPSGFAPNCRQLGGSVKLEQQYISSIKSVSECRSKCQEFPEKCLFWNFGYACELNLLEVERTGNTDAYGYGFCKRIYSNYSPSIYSNYSPSKVTASKVTAVSTYEGAPWWCTFYGSKCGDNCCKHDQCCEGPNVCATGVDCANQKCEWRGGQICGTKGNCCEKGKICCANSEGENVCVDSFEDCRVQNCEDKGGLTCGDQCCKKGSSTCCQGLKERICVDSFQDCKALRCSQKNGIQCGTGCCVGGTFCCQDHCVTDAVDCLSSLCLQKGGQMCGFSCCTDKTKFCCQDSQTCVEEEFQCQIKSCPLWCEEQQSCCKYPYGVCCGKEAPFTCAANPIYCRKELYDTLGKFAEYFTQRKIA